MTVSGGVLVGWDTLPPEAPWVPLAGANGTLLGRLDQVTGLCGSACVIHQGKGADDVYGYEYQHFQGLDGNKKECPNIVLYVIYFSTAHLL